MAGVRIWIHAAERRMTPVISSHTERPHAVNTQVQ